MLSASYDSRCIDSIADNLFFYNLIGSRIIRLNFSNIYAGERTLVDIIQEFPNIIGLGIGVGNDQTIFERKGVKLYNSIYIKHIIIHLSPARPFEIPLPKNLDELSLEFTHKTEGGVVGEYLKKIITRDCKPILKFILPENVTSWREMRPPPQVHTIKCIRTNSVPVEFLERMEELGYRKVGETQEYVFEKN